jgi:5-methylcytosine-specific restriction protein A
MPQAPRRACRSGCPHFQPCPVHNKRQWRRPAESSTIRGYDARHRALRRQVLEEEPICRLCRLRPSLIADHVVPLRRGGRTVRKNLQGLCQECSGSKTGREGAQARAALASGLLAGPKGDGAPVPSSRRLRDFLPLSDVAPAGASRVALAGAPATEHADHHQGRWSGPAARGLPAHGLPGAQPRPRHERADVRDRDAHRIHDAPSAPRGSAAGCSVAGRDGGAGATRSHPVSTQSREQGIQQS